MDKDKRKYSSDFEFFLKRDIPEHQIIAILKSQNKKDDEIGSILDKLNHERVRLYKVVNKIMAKLNSKLFGLDLPEKVRKGMKYAEKYDLNEIEKTVLRKQLMDNNPSLTQYSYTEQVKNTEMSKFLGFDSAALSRPPGLTGFTGVPGYAGVDPRSINVLKLQAKDHLKLNELSVLYENTKILYTNIKQQTYLYDEKSTSHFNSNPPSDSVNPSLHIHPLLYALFIPKIASLQKRMLLTNIGRMLLMRSYPYLNEKSQFNDIGMLPDEYMNELDFLYDIATDPNSLEYFTGSSNSPIDNLIKRFKIQIELWKTILQLRNGNYFAKSYDDPSNCVAGLLKTLNSYDWTYFDNPDMHMQEDDGNLLRKILSVFSFRPTYVQYTTIPNLMTVNTMRFNEFARPTFANIPIITVRLRNALQFSQPVEMKQISLSDYINGEDFIFEHKIPVMKRRTVFCSNDVIFFHVNRKQINMTAIETPGLQAANCNLRFAMMAPGMLPSSQGVNETAVFVPPIITVGNDSYNLTSVVSCVTRTINSNTLLLNSVAHYIPKEETTFAAIRYDPQFANRTVPAVSREDDVASYNKEISTSGTVFVYNKESS